MCSSLASSIMSVDDLDNKLSSAKYQLKNIFYYKGAWRIWMVPDWRL